MRVLLSTCIALLLLAPLPLMARHHEPPPKEEASDESAAEKPDDQNEEKEEDEDKGPFKPFDEVTEDTELQEGMFDIYQKAGTLLLAIEPDQLGMDFLMNFEIARGVGARGLNGGTMLNIFEGNIMALERHGDNIYLKQRVHQMRADDERSWQETLDISFGASVVATAEIQTVREEDEAILIDINDWIVSDLSGVSRRVGFAVSTTPGKPGQASLDGKRSYLESVKVFPENINFRSKLTFSLKEPPPFDSLADWRSLPLSIHTTMVKLPEDPMEPRLGDDRMGYFLTVHKNFSRTEDTFFTRYCNKWRLEKGKKSGRLYKPKKPIVYYLDRTIPKEHRASIKRGVEQWNRAFEVAGFKDAIKADMLPDDADAEDIRYPTIRWMATDRNSYLAIGPSVVDPRTGEILDADILVDSVFALRTWSQWERLVDPATAVNEIFAEDPELEARGYAVEHANFRSQLQLQAGLTHASLVASGAIRPGEPMPKEFVDSFMAWMIMHEVGHTLGLRHNFRSSIDTPMNRLHDKSWTEENGLVSSVMDYSAANIAPDGGPSGQYYGTTIGTADKWVISYGYHHDERKVAEIARQASQPGHAYGSDEDRSGPGALDPTVNAWDLGADPLAWSKERADIIRGLYPGLHDRVLVDNAPYADVTATVQTLVGNYAVSLSPAVKYIGGQYVYRNHAGDPAGKAPFVPVPKAKQREAMQHIISSCFSLEAFMLPVEVLRTMGPNRWNHWGSNTTFGGRIDYPYHEQVLGIQRAYLDQLVHPFRLARMSDSEIKFGASSVLTIPELMDAVTKAVFAELDQNQSSIASMRRNLQRAYVDKMTALLVKPEPRTPADARAMARLELKELQAKMAGAVEGGPSYDRATLAHLEELRERIEMVLDAGLEVEVP